MSWMSKVFGRDRPPADQHDASIRAAGASTRDDAFADLVATGEIALQTKTAAHAALWGLGDETAWDVDQERGVIRFERADGRVAEAPVQILGTFDPGSSTFLWAWDHPSVLAPLAKAARDLRAWGVTRDVGALTTRKITLRAEDDAWRFVAAALALTGAEGGYRGETDDAVVFMTFGTVTLSR